MAVLTGHEQIRGAKSIQIAQLFDAVDSLCAGERVLLTGTVYTARDAAHKRLTALLDASQPLPFPLEEAVRGHWRHSISHRAMWWHLKN
jgi:hypothetical protein